MASLLIVANFFIVSVSPTAKPTCEEINSVVTIRLAKTLKEGHDQAPNNGTVESKVDFRSGCEHVTSITNKRPVHFVNNPNIV